MTRETKIGLLVGLAFIIVVAILLTDHASSVNDPKPAAQSDAGSNVRQSVTTPAPAGPTAGADAPRSQVPTRGDLTPREPAGAPVKFVEVGPGTTPPGPAGEPPLALPPMDTVRDSSTPPTGVAGRGTKPGRGQPDLVSEHPEDFTHVGGGSTGNGPTNSGGTASGGTKPPAGAPGKPTPPVTPPKTYTAEAGDTVSRIAAKQMAGGNTKANREALIKANPSLQGEGNIVYLGKPYVIPSPGAAAQAADATPVKPPTTPGAPAFPTPPTVGANAAWYTVKDNDNLWRIAARELGDGNLWTTIRDMNKDVLKGGETVKANMRIRLPKSTATASVN